MKGFYIEVTNNLLEPKHRKQMGISVWLFMLLLDKITSVTEDGEGIILGGRPIECKKDIYPDLGCTQSDYKYWLSVLTKYNYIRTKRTPYGLIISVNKAKKRFGRKTTIKKKEIVNDLLSSEKTLKTKNREIVKNSQEIVNSLTSNIEHNNTIDNNNMSKTSFDPQTELDKLLKDKQRHIQIIGLWIKYNKLVVENKEQLQSIIKRNLRPARELNGYSNEDIIKTFEVVKSTDYISKFTLETIGKFIGDVKKEIIQAIATKIIKWEQLKKPDGTVVMRAIVNKPT